MNVVHISPTPLVGAPGKVAWALRHAGHNAVAIAISDYPQGGPLEGLFINHYLLWGQQFQPQIEQLIAQADVIHVHNDLPQAVADQIFELNQDADYVYQVHSPLREGPLYANRVAEIGLPFRRQLVVGQHWGRLYPFYTTVPNLVIGPPSVALRQLGERLRVMFSPTHMHAGRWTSKHSAGLVEGLQHLEAIELIELLMPDKPIHPQALMELRRTCHITIDEVATGGFHQVSLEGLCAGNIVINRADWFAKAMYGAFCGGNPPPFLFATAKSTISELVMLASDVAMTREWQQRSFDFFVAHCDPMSQIKFYEDIYNEASHETASAQKY